MWTTILFSTLLGMTPLQDHKPRTQSEMHRLHEDSAAYIAMLEDPQRDAYQKPHEVIQALNIKPGETIADIGAGSGYFSFRLAHHVGAQGRVYAVDISPDMIRHVNRRIRDTGVSQVVSILSDADDPLLPAHSVDRVLICDTWHHIGNPADYLEKIKQALKPGGQVIMIDFQKRELPVGPSLEMKIAREDLITQMEGAGFSLSQEHTFLPYQYFLIFTVR